MTHVIIFLSVLSKGLQVSQVQAQPHKKRPVTKVWGGIPSKYSKILDDSQHSEMVFPVNIQRSEMVFIGIRQHSKIWNGIPSQHAKIGDGIPSQHAKISDSIPSQHSTIWGGILSQHSKIWDGIPSHHYKIWEGIPSPHIGSEPAFWDLRRYLQSTLNHLKRYSQPTL